LAITVAADRAGGHVTVGVIAKVIGAHGCALNEL
jgi:hypothetical protein